MASGRLIDYLGEGNLAARPATPDLAAGALGLYFAEDTDTLYAWDGTAWNAISSGGGSGAPITVTTADTGTTLTATGANAWNYTRFTNAAAKTYQFDSAETYELNSEYHGRNVGAGDLTIAQVGSFVITPPVGGSLVIPSGQTFFLKITGASTADLILQSPSGTGPPPSADMPRFIEANANAWTTAISQDAVIPASAVVGDLLIASVMARDTLTPPAGWTLAVSQLCTNGSNNQTQYIYYRICQIGDPGATTTWAQATNQRISVSIGAFRKSTDAWTLITTDAAALNSTVTQANVIAFPSAVATAPNQLAIACGGITNTNVFVDTGIISISGLAAYGTVWAQSSANPPRSAQAYRVLDIGDATDGMLWVPIAPTSGPNGLNSVVAIFQ